MIAAFTTDIPALTRWDSRCSSVRAQFMSPTPTVSTSRRSSYSMPSTYTRASRGSYWQILTEGRHGAALLICHSHSSEQESIHRHPDRSGGPAVLYHLHHSPCRWIFVRPAIFAVPTRVFGAQLATQLCLSKLAPRACPEVLCHAAAGHRVSRGVPLPFGASVRRHGVNFSIFSKHATSCTWCSFSRARPIPLSNFHSILV